MREFIMVQNTFKLPELRYSLLQNFKSIAVVILQLIKYLILLNMYLEMVALLYVHNFTK